MLDSDSTNFIKLLSFGGVLHPISCYRKWNPSGNIAPKSLRIAVQSHEVYHCLGRVAIWINYDKLMIPRTTINKLIIIK